MTDIGGLLVVRSARQDDELHQTAMKAMDKWGNE
jgi:hypothetical protein